MATEVKMPSVSPTMEYGTLAKWLVAEGDVVRAGDRIAEIETDKATMEIEAPAAGRIAGLLIAEGTESVAVGTVIAIITAAHTGSSPEPISPKKTTLPLHPLASIREPARPLPAAPATEAEPPRTSTEDRVNASPLAVRMALLAGLDLAGIVGSGPGGRIRRCDLGLPTAPQGTGLRATLPPDVPHEIVKLSSMRRTIALRLTESKQQIPHIYLTVDVHLDKLLEMRAELNQSLVAQGGKLSVNDMVIKALALALTAVPACNVQFAGNQLFRFHRVDVAVAVSIPGGLITPVIKSAESRSLQAISAEMKHLAARARAGRLQPQDYQGGTASLSNLGMFGINQFAAVINPPQATIMAVGAGRPRPLVVENAISIATALSATGSFDHRAIDGAEAAALMQAFKRNLENPGSLLV